MDLSELIRYLTNNIPLFAISAVLLFLAIRNLKFKKSESSLFIGFTLIVLFLSIVVEQEKYSQATGRVVVGTIFTSIGYITRPILLYIFILLTNMGYKRPRKFYAMCMIPLFICTIVYIFPLMFGVPVVSKMVFYYQEIPGGGARFYRGTILPLNFFSHAVSLFYIFVLVYISMKMFQGKHRRDGIVIILCALIIIITVVVEVLTNRNDLLNIVCEICAMINYIFILSVDTSRDSLTHLYDRRTYYQDLARYERIINGVIEIDMNELKFVNDNFGHSVGDEALNELARIFENCIDPASMCVYRMSGDEFLVLMFNGKEEWLSDAVFTIKEELKTSTYSAAVGYYFIDRTKEIITLEEAMKRAEQYMYKDKNEFYARTKHNRRRE